jgi:hypothetical protein
MNELLRIVLGFDIMWKSKTNDEKENRNLTKLICVYNFHLQLAPYIHMSRETHPVNQVPKYVLIDVGKW